jgi:hypothetical protein
MARVLQLDHNSSPELRFAGGDTEKLSEVRY